MGLEELIGRVTAPGQPWPGQAPGAYAAGTPEARKAAALTTHLTTGRMAASSTKAVQLVPGNPSRSSLTLKNADTGIGIYFDSSQLQTPVQAIGHYLGPGDAYTFTADGDRPCFAGPIWIVAASGTPYMTYAEVSSE